MQRRDPGAGGDEPPGQLDRQPPPAGHADRRVRPERGVHARLRARVDDEHEGRRPLSHRRALLEPMQLLGGASGRARRRRGATHRSAGGRPGMVERAGLGLVAGDRLGRRGQRAPALGEQEEQLLDGPRPPDRGCPARPGARRPATRPRRPGAAACASQRRDPVVCAKACATFQSPSPPGARSSVLGQVAQDGLRGRRRSPRAGRGSSQRSHARLGGGSRDGRRAPRMTGPLLVDRLPDRDHVRGARLKGGQPCGGRHRYRS